MGWAVKVGFAMNGYVWLRNGCAVGACRGTFDLVWLWNCSQGSVRFVKSRTGMYRNGRKSNSERKT